MNHYIDAFLQFAQVHKELGYLAMFFISFLESIAFIGELIPGTTLLVIIGALAAKGVFDPEMLIAASSLGAIAGDVLSFWLGRKGEGSLGRFSSFVKPEYLKKGQDFVNKHGSKSILLGRFIGPLRPIVPFVTGLLRMNLKKFIVWDTLSAFSWSIVYIYLGNALGIVWEFAKLWSTRGGLLVIMLITTVAVIILLRKYIARQSAVFLVHTGNLWEKLTNYLNSKPSAFSHFLAKRFDKDTLSGLKLTLGLIIFAVILFNFSSIVSNILNDGIVTASDSRMAGYLYRFRTPGMVEFFSWIGALGSVLIIAGLGLAVTIMMWLVKEPGYIIPMWTGMVGSFICNYTGGMIIKRQVTVVPAINENIYYFPSANATLSIMFYGFIIYFVFKTFKNLSIKLNTFFILLPLIMFISFSRIYLGIHYYSDIQAGLFLGVLWLIVSMGMSEYLEYRHPHEQISGVSKKTKALSAAFAALWLVLFLFFGLSEYSKFVETKTAVRKTLIADHTGIFSQLNMQSYTESLFGEYREPINVIISTKSKEDLIACLEKSGWYMSDESDYSSLLKRTKAIIMNENYYSTPVAPSFWRNSIQDISFGMPSLKIGIAEMHWLKLWDTGVTDKYNNRVYVGIVSYNISLGSRLTHLTSPDIDAERNLLIKSLKKSGAAQSEQLVKISDRYHKKKLFSRNYHTDGKAAEFTLGNCSAAEPL